GLVQADRQRTAPRQHIFEAGDCLAGERCEFAVEATHPRLEIEVEGGMIVQMLADRWVGLDDGDAGAAKLVLASDSRKHEEMRRSDRPGADDHFAARHRLPLASLLFEAYAGGALACKEDAPCHRAGL